MSEYKKNDSKYTERFKTYNQKCKMYSLRFRKDSEKKYIDFLTACPNMKEFIKQAIDRELRRQEA